MLSEQKIVEMLVHLLSGSIAGAASTGCCYPFANLRLRRIAQYIYIFIIKGFKKSWYRAEYKSEWDSE